MSNNEELEVDVLSETDNFAIWRSQEEEEFLYHVELGAITLHLTSEEWEELVILVKGAA